jgi:hypothetical protein
MRKGGLLPGLAFLALSVLLVGTMWIVPYLPTNDGPEWVFATHAENHYGDPGTIYRDVLTPALQFASRGFTPLYGPFDAWLGWRRGLQVALSLTALLSAWGFVALVRALHRERWALGFLGFPLALTWELYMGLWAFVVSTAVGILVLAVAVRVREPTWRGRVLLSLLLLVNAVAHVFGAVLTGGAVLLLSLARAPRGGRAKEALWVLLTGLPAAGILLATYLVSRNLTLAPFAHDFGRMTWANAAASFPRTVAPGPLVRALLVTLAVVLASALALARATKAETSASDRGLGVAAVVLILLGAFAPFQIPGWQAFSQRFVPMGALLVMAVVPIERAPTSLRRLLPPLLFSLAALYLVLTYPFHKRLAALCPDAIAGLEAPVATSGTILPVTLAATELPSYDRIHAEVPLLVPLLHMGTLYAAAHGGVSAYSFASTPAVYPFVLRPTTTHRPMPEMEHYTKALNSPEFGSDLAYRLEIENELASFGVFYDEVAVFAALPPDLALWAERGYVTDWQKGGALVAHFEPCSIDFATPAFAIDPPPTFTLSVGKIGLAKGVSVPPVVRGKSAHFKLAPAPCGIVTVRADWPEAVHATCANANANGSFLTRVTRTGGRIVCDVSR